MCSIMGVCGSGYTKDFTKAQFEECFGRTLSRGPDMSRVIETESGSARVSPARNHGSERNGNAAV